MAEPLDTQRMLQWKLAGILERHVERIFKAGTKLTIIARTPGNDEADVLVTSDDLRELAKLVQRSMARPDVAGVQGNAEAQAWRKAAQAGGQAEPTEQQREALRRGRETLAKMNAADGVGGPDGR